jgi:hypothetical protein
MKNVVLALFVVSICSAVSQAGTCEIKVSHHDANVRLGVICPYGPYSCGPVVRHLRQYKIEARGGPVKGYYLMTDFFNRKNQQDEIWAAVKEKVDEIENGTDCQWDGKFDI